MITLRASKRNLTALAKELSPRHWQEGRAWYKEAHNYCADLAREHDVALDVVIGGLAVMSPQTEWNTNKQAILAVIQTGSYGGQVYPVNIGKAVRILAGESFLSVTQHPRYGSKVRAFYDNILNCADSEDVTVDTHAIRAAFNRASVPEKQVRWVFGTRIGYNTLRLAYQQVARSLGARPLHFQAAIWLLTKERLAEA
jgi:hypothetical protein